MVAGDAQASGSQLLLCGRLRGDLSPQPLVGDAVGPFALAELLQGLGPGRLHEIRHKLHGPSRGCLGVGSHRGWNASELGQVGSRVGDRLRVLDLSLPGCRKVREECRVAVEIAGFDDGASLARSV